MLPYRHIGEKERYKMSNKFAEIAKKETTLSEVMQKKYKDRIFDAFTDDLYIPPEYTGKNTHTYIDYEIHGILKDYNGKYAEYDELSGVHLMPADYSLTLSDAYLNYLTGIISKER